ncbi:MAG TPA: phosphatase PAP2 family protein [Pseudobdellovibrionaceae bacterium]|nr:phosphatase PAP2 family protein [Pseudobdellovibrionaceae bacterium]
MQRSFVQLTLLAIFALCSSPASAWWDAHVAPTIPRLTDQTSQRLGLATALTLLATRPHDEELRDTWRDHQRMSKPMADFGNHYALYGIPAFIALGEYGFVDEAKGLNHIRSLLFTFASTSSLKLITQRERPNQLNRYSLPSGHSSFAFASATALHMNYGWRASLPAGAVAIIVGLSRMTDDYHWATDVVAGAALGIWMGRAASFSSESSSASVQWGVWSAGRMAPGLSIAWTY